MSACDIGSVCRGFSSMSSSRVGSARLAGEGAQGVDGPCDRTRVPCEYPRGQVVPPGKWEQIEEPDRVATSACSTVRPMSATTPGDSNVSVDVSVDGATRRLTSLDGLRGVCAVVVLLGHGLLAAPILSDAVLRSAPLEPGSWPWLLTNTPLHLAWAGSEAVLVFFAMSGLVLALPLTRSPSRWSWTSYYPRRLVRLYLPLTAAALFSWLLVVVQSRKPVATASDFTNANQASFAPRAVVKDIFVVFGVDTLNGAFWSLQWEVIFSLLLPVFALLLLVRRLPALVVGGLLVVVSASGSVARHVGAISPTAVGAAIYLPVFALGVLLAANWPQVLRCGRWLDGAPAIVALAGWVGLLLLLVLPWIGPGCLSTSTPGHALATAGQTFAAVCLVALVAATGVGRRCFSGHVVGWLGARSFSIYLVHSPIIITTTFVLGGTPNAVLVLVIAGPLALAAADVFYRTVERPSITFSRRLGRFAHNHLHRNRASEVR